MGIAEYPPYGGRFRVGFVAIPEKLLFAENTFAAGDIERNEYVVAYFEFGHFRSYLFHYPYEFMTERGTDARVGHHSVVKMQVGPAYAGARHPHNCISRMLDPRHRHVAIRADPVRPSIIHCYHVVLV